MGMKTHTCILAGKCHDRHLSTRVVRKELGDVQNATVDNNPAVFLMPSKNSNFLFPFVPLFCDASGSLCTGMG